jgi:dTDP-4-dehydrorhamnose reductase
MKVFIFGTTGMLGNYIKTLLSKTTKIITLTRKDYDLSNLSIVSLSEFLLSKNLQKNDIVINCAGVIPQSSKQRGLNTRLYFTINSLFPVILSQLCDKYEAKMIHITTDCVFSGKDGKYNENSIHDEINDYGLSKSLGELCKATIIRTSIIGEEVNNKRSLLEWVRTNSGKEINGYINHFWNGVTCLQLAKIVEKIIVENKFWNGVRHIFSPKSVSKYELISMINKVYNLDIKINKVETKNSVNKTIKSIYDNDFLIPELFQQIEELKYFNI